MIAPVALDSGAIPVALDPGHPSKPGDTGCVSPDGTLFEYDYTLSMSRMVAKILRLMNSQIKPVLLRERSDEVVSLKERGKRSTDAGAKLVVSIHVNSSVNNRQHGCLGFHWPRNWMGRDISNAILNAMPPQIRSKWLSIEALNKPDTPDDDWLDAPRDVMRYHPATTILTELPYASNANDLKALHDDDVKLAMCMAIVTGILQMPLYLPGGLYG